MSRNFLAGLLMLLIYNIPCSAQTMNGMSTGNYAGIAGLNFNPASIVDSRYKFDFNIANAQYYFGNNFLVAKPLIFARRLLYKDPYNSSFEAVKRDLLMPIEPPPGGVVKARQNTEFQLPLSFMLTTGKRSAIAINLRNRSELTIDNLNPQTASMFYNNLDDKRYLGVAMNNDGLVQNFMNWQEIGFTYGRVLINAKKHFIKAAVTAKWLGGNAASYIQADKLSATFNDPNTLSLSSPRIQYARSSRADIDLFTRRELFSNLEDQSLGWDAGFVYEFRGRIGNFRYTDEDYNNRLRRDRNKYTFRLGVAINDVGSLVYNRLPLTRNHSANISNWDFSAVKAQNFRTWDTAYSKKINYIAGEDSTFSVKLPTGILANIDLHLFGVLYVNAAIQRPFDKIGKQTTTTLYSSEWFAVTPRFEGRHFGLYIPVLIREKNTQIGATVRLGPFYVGSNNLMALIQNPMVSSADVHAGIRIPIGFGKPSKLAKMVEKSSGIPLSNENEKELAGSQTKQTELEQRVMLLEKMMDSSYRTPPTIIVNNYIDRDSLGKQQVQTQVIQKQSEKTAERKTVASTYTQAQEDSTNTETKKMRQEVEKRMKEEGVEPPKDPKTKSKKNKKEPVEGSKADKKAKKAEQRYQRESQQYNSAVEAELSKMRRQQAITSTAVVGAISANAVVNANDNKAEKPPVIKDTVVIEKIKTDTIYIRDTIRIMLNETVPANNLQPAAKAVSELGTVSVFFASGSASISKNDTKALNNAAAWMQKNPDSKILLSGVTDATGTPELNRKLAQKRIDAVKKVFEQKGIAPSRFEEDILTSNVKTNMSSSTNRRVDIKQIQ